MDETDESLMRRYVADADRAAFEALFHRYAPRLRRYFGGRVRTRGLVDDLTQQTFLHVHRARNDFRQDGRFRPWVFAIAANLVREHYRYKGRRPEYPAGQDLPVTPVEPDASTATERLVRRAIESLPEHERDVLILHWFEELSFREVADVVGASYSAVKVRAHRAYKKLREQLEESS